MKVSLCFPAPFIIISVANRRERFRQRVSGRIYMMLKLAVLLAILIMGLSCGSNLESSSEALAPRTSPVQAGEMAPDFTLEDQHNQKVKLSSARGATTVLVFYRGYW
jgi:cytochrome oxidase Cu insertion factor (SCO1/SenC/PrrC family)